MAQENSQSLRERDVGLQPERTLLSWSRTVLLLFLHALVLVKVGWTKGVPALLLVAGAVSIASFALLALIELRRIDYRFTLPLLNLRSVGMNLFFSVAVAASAGCYIVALLLRGG
ncbi:DUF202 domain-containing protein [Photobacterium sanctipauli]|uniref:DUF202 domain-containing protein n=1 Tax=Photobacterium sanctipauli TaxID=1342794 RepID=UPI001B8723AA|nr:DUF202 domain-containing protein [Photobacterium sanctipauli]